MKHITEYLREIFEERSAILEYDAGYPREEAERLAMEELTKRRKVIDEDKRGAM